MGSLGEKLHAAQAVGLDSAIFIYYFEEHPRYQALCAEAFDLMEAGAIQTVTSVITFIEVLTQPLAKGEQKLYSRYEQYLRFGPSLTLRSLDPDLALRAAQLRARYQIRTPDAIQLAAAIEFGAHLFLTNDDRLRKVTEIEVIVLERWLQQQTPPQTDEET
ncbi:MAG TPA: PIN domain-containing protein [Candidatus Acidoferrales bacterium]|nr:PIN domain-containing protein [Candidatus Acidoferrales bacterium]